MSDSNGSQIRGLIIRAQSGFFTVKAEADYYVCQLRGRLKQGPREGDIASLGDWVRISLINNETGMIEEIEPRHSMISRMAPQPQGEYQQIIIANPDQAFFIFACAEPQPRLGMLDRFLVIAEKQNLPAIIVANKVDLVGIDLARSMFSHYEPLGYELVYTSAKTGQGVADMKARLTSKISLLAGPSGVGKSSLLNAIQPGLGLASRAISQATSKGRHTTVVRELFPVEGGGYVADTPGLKALALWDIEPEEIDAYFPELRSRVESCQFSDCTHVHEPGCAVLAAVETGQIHQDRYQSYLRMRFGEDE